MSAVGRSGTQQGLEQAGKRHQPKRHDRRPQKGEAQTRRDGKIGEKVLDLPRQACAQLPIRRKKRRNHNCGDRGGGGYNPSHLGSCGHDAVDLTLHIASTGGLGVTSRVAPPQEELG